MQPTRPSVCLACCFQVLAVSSAASVFGLMPDVPPMTLAAWRLQLTAAVLAVGAVVQWRRMVQRIGSEAASQGAAMG